MGANDHAKQPNRNTTTPKPSRYGSLGTKSNKGPITWASVDGPSIKRAVDAVTSCGDAITFGRTTDGGALSITILSGTERRKLYASEVDEANDTLAAIIEATGL